MATRLYSISNDARAEGDGSVVVTEAIGSATVTTAIELTVDLAVITDKTRLIVALQKIQDYLLQGSWPPV